MFTAKDRVVYGGREYKKNETILSELPTLNVVDFGYTTDRKIDNSFVINQVKINKIDHSPTIFYSIIDREHIDFDFLY